MNTIELTCTGCGKLFDKQVKEYNRICRKGKSKFFCSRACSGGHIERPNQQFWACDVPCLYCGKYFTTTLHPKDRKCCSIQCAKKYARSKAIIDDAFREKMSTVVKKSWEDGVYRDLQPQFSSKGERDLRDYIRSVYPEAGYTTGMLIPHLRINPDIWSKISKIVIEYDGIWHFEDINGQLEKKQKKDRELNAWCVENGWRIIRIRDELYTKNKDLWRKRIVEEIENGTSSVRTFYTDDEKIIVDKSGVIGQYVVSQV